MAPSVVCDFYHLKYTTMDKDECATQLELRPYLDSCAVSKSNMENQFTNFGYFLLEKEEGVDTFVGVDKQMTFFNRIDTRSKFFDGGWHR